MLRSCDALIWVPSEYCGNQRQQCCRNTLLQNMYYVSQFESKVCLYSTDKEKIPSTKMTNAHAQYFLVNNVLLLPNLKTFAQLTRSIHATRNASYFQSVRSSRTVCRCYKSLYSGASQSEQPSHRARHAPPLSGSSPYLPCINTVQRFL